MHPVLYALVPGVLYATWLYGARMLLHLFVASATALLAEALVLRLRRQPLRPALRDGSALITAWLLSLCLSPIAAWWVSALGAGFAVLLVKHLYGGLGRNLFNPAMAGYAFLLLCFPAQLVYWPLPAGVDWPDAFSSATPLSHVRAGLANMATVPELRTMPIFDAWSATAGLTALWFLGGLWLLWRRIINWQVPAALLGTLFFLALVFYLYDDGRYLSPWFHLCNGGVMLGAFFIATDPVSGPVTPRAQLLYGAVIGLLIWGIRGWGHFPDGVAFAVLLANGAVPLLDRYTRPRVLGGSTA